MEEELAKRNEKLKKIKEEHKPINLEEINQHD